MTAAPRTALWTESLVFANRHFLQWRRNPVILLQSLLFPTILLVIYYLLVSKSMTRLTGDASLEVVVSMCALAGGFSGALATALTVPGERDGGLLSRFWVQPIHRASALMGMLLAEAIRTLVATVAITALGLVLGLRFHGGVGAAIAFVGIPVLWVTVYACLIITIALRFHSRSIMTWLSALPLGAVFCSSAVVPMDLVPGWLEPFVRAQPMSPAIEAMRDLARGEPAAEPLLWTLGWVIVVGACAVTFAVRSYRAAVQSAGA